MRILFAGSPEFAAVLLRALLDAGREVVAVLTQPDRPAGRGLRQTASAVKQCAQSVGLPIMQPATLRTAESQALIASLRPDVMVVAAYGLILPAAVLALPPLGCLNAHASLLPRWRGAAPIQRALLAGDRETGICIMRMEEGLDTGPVLLREAIAIGAQDSAASLHDRLAALAARLMVRALAALEVGDLPAVPQPVDGVTYAHKLSREEANIDWARPAIEIERALRAYDPFPGAHTRCEGETWKLWRARVAPGLPGLVPGTLVVTRDALRVACGSDAIEILELQRAGARRVGVAEFLRGRTPPAGTRLGAPVAAP